MKMKIYPRVRQTLLFLFTFLNANWFMKNDSLVERNLRLKYLNYLPVFREK